MSSLQSTHVLVFPYPAQGHMLPILDLTHQLALQGITITILVTPKSLPTLNPLLSLNPSIQTLVFPFPSHPSLPSGVENVKDIGNHGNLPIISALSKLQAPIIHWFRSHPNPPVAILSDFFLGWTQHLAQEIGVPRIAFYSSGAFFTSLVNHLWPNIEYFRSLEVVNFPDLPRSPSFREEHLPSVCRRYRKSDPDSEIVRNGMIANTTSWGAVFNTFHALEGEYMEHLKKTMGQGRVFAVGPLSLSESSNRGNPDLDSSYRSVLAWLDKCNDGSVLYVSFGSQKLLNKAQMEALACGLDQSGVQFIWVVKPGTAQQMEEGYGLVPHWFEERVSGRGIVMKDWAPQVAILSHPAVGGFLSHCGWNSVLEAMVAGVVILAWPMEADQFMNARLLVEYMGVGIQVCEGADALPDSAELAWNIDESMSGYTVVKVKAKQLEGKAREAVKAGGSSSLDLEGLVKELARLT